MKEIFMNAFPIIVFIFIFYFILIKPMRDVSDEKDLLLQKIKLNDEIITNSGIIGKIKKINKDSFLIQSGNFEFEITKNSIDKIKNEK